MRRAIKAAGYEDEDILPGATDGGGQIPDYTILPDTRYTWYLEAKKWGLQLQDVHATQATNYCNTNGKRWVVLTNGMQWRLYDNHILKTTPEKRVAVADIANIEVLARFLEAIGKDSVTADRLAGFAAEEVQAEQKRQHEQAEAQRAESIQAALEKTCRIELQTPESQLIEAICSVLRQREGFQELKPADLVAYLSARLREKPNEGQPSGSTFTEVVSEELNKRGEFTVLWRGKADIWFLPTSLLRVLPRNAAQGTFDLDQGVSVCCWMYMGTDGRMEFNFECCRMTDRNLKLRLVKALAGAGFKFIRWAYEDKTFSRFWMAEYTRRARVSPNDVNNIREVVGRLLDERKEGFQILEAVCRKVFSARE